MVRLVVWTELELVGRVDTGRFKGLLKVHLCAYTDTRYAYALHYGGVIRRVDMRMCGRWVTVGIALVDE
jgi:hypothetical protein